MCLTILGAPRTKKNHGRRVYSFKRKRTFQVPSEAQEQWAIAAARELRSAWAGRSPLAGPVQVRALIYREADTGDLLGYEEAIADVLEAPTKRTSDFGRLMKASVIVNDKQIVSWDGSRPLKDAEHPRIELEITELSGS